MIIAILTSLALSQVPDVYWESLTKKEKRQALELAAPVVTDYIDDPGIIRDDLSGDEVTLPLSYELFHGSLEDNVPKRALYFNVMNMLVTRTFPNEEWFLPIGHYAARLIAEFPDYTLSYILKDSTLVEMYARKIGISFEEYYFAKHDNLARFKFEVLGRTTMSLTQIRPFFDSIYYHQGVVLKERYPGKRKDRNFLYWEQVDNRLQEETFKRVDNRFASDLDSFFSRYDYTMSLGDQVLKICDRLISEENTDDPYLKAMYFSLFNRICADTDPGTEYLDQIAELCLKQIEKDPDYVLTYLLDHEPVMDKYAMLIGKHLGIIFDQHWYSRSKGYRTESCNLDTMYAARYRIFVDCSLSWESVSQFFDLIYSYAKKECVYL